ncbi:DUF6907 domain-containing protein [Streptomyces sp. NBC_00996]|uniref:DUF6907 domain-containing protein n=1 Tax=Streptomyces sp. NBC_00996 TaxID=2903710 RepID=UPI003868AE83|nr:hypothetical protein OG390_25000 [Streptomyces sp. NBC_00996]
MSAPRTVTIRTVDHGPVTIPEPSWCAGRHPDGGARVDITHVGPDRPLTIPTRRGPAVHLVTALESRPFVAESFLRGPFVAVEIGGDWYETGLAGLERMASELEAHAEQLRDRARGLAVILAGGEGR